MLGAWLIGALVLVPVVFALILLLVRNDRARSYITVIGALVIACMSIFAAVKFLTGQVSVYTLDEGLSKVVDHVALVIDIILCGYIIARAYICKKPLAALLALVQLVLVVVLDLTIANSIEVSHALYIDNLSIIMALIIGIIGSGIAVYALGYMRVHEAHNDGPDRRPVFFALMFLFLGAMFAIVFSNALTWMLCAWEVTTVCSFALIGYTRTAEAIKNSFLQIVLNLIGGIAFTAALIWIGKVYGVMELDTFLQMTQQFVASGYGLLTYAPLLLLSLAAFTKAAQMPFQNWLLGAMVAPTPTSALLHSSTMVKAGVFLLIKLAPCLGFGIPGYIVMAVGGATFLFCALAAISQSNAKRVLAYSTISNLGLITACAGVGTDGAIWAAIFLVVFHAAAKSLLFLCVGTAEHQIGSRDIEDMDDLFERMPRLARFMALGIMGMFIAPFGMLISKWAALQSFAQSENIVLLLLLVFGSAATFVFWAKWLGKVLAIANNAPKNLEGRIYRSEWSALGLMAALTVLCCFAFPLISGGAVVPYLSSVFGEGSSVIADGDLWLMAIIALFVVIILVMSKGATKKRKLDVYMAGINVNNEERSFVDSFGNIRPSLQRNWYMNEMFPEKKVALIGALVSVVLIVGSFGFTAQAVADQKDTVTQTMSRQAAYHESMWPQVGAPFTDYLQYYETYEAYYQQNAEALKEQMGIESMDQFMNMLVAQMVQSQGLGTDGYDEGEEG